MNITAYQLNLDAVFETVNRQTMKTTSFSDTKIIGNIYMANPGRQKKNCWENRIFF